MNAWHQSFAFWRINAQIVFDLWSICKHQYTLLLHIIKQSKLIVPICPFVYVNISHVTFTTYLTEDMIVRCDSNPTCSCIQKIKLMLAKLPVLNSAYISRIFLRRALTSGALLVFPKSSCLVLVPFLMGISILFADATVVGLQSPLTAVSSNVDILLSSYLLLPYDVKPMDRSATIAVKSVPIDPTFCDRVRKIHECGGILLFL